MTGLLGRLRRSSTPPHSPPYDEEEGSGSRAKEGDSSGMNVTASPYIRRGSADIASESPGGFEERKEGGQHAAASSNPTATATAVYRGVHTERGLKGVPPRHHIHRSSAPPLTPVQEEHGFDARGRSGSETSARGYSTEGSGHDDRTPPAPPPIRIPLSGTRNAPFSASQHLHSLRQTSSTLKPPPVPFLERSASDSFLSDKPDASGLGRRDRRKKEESDGPNEQLLSSPSSESNFETPTGMNGRSERPSLSPVPPGSPSPLGRFASTHASRRAAEPPTAAQTRRLLHSRQNSDSSQPALANIRHPHVPQRYNTDFLDTLSPGSSDRDTVLLHNSSEED